MYYDTREWRIARVCRVAGMDEDPSALIGIGERNGRHVPLRGDLGIGRIPDRNVFAELSRQPIAAFLDAQPVVFRMIASGSYGFAHEPDERDAVPRRRWGAVDEHLVRTVGADLVAAAMNLVLLADDAYGFLFSWELMSLTSWALVVSRHTDADNRHAGHVYLVMAAIGTASLLFALAPPEFVQVRCGTGRWP
jgi:hypothetical protein